MERWFPQCWTSAADQNIQGLVFPFTLDLFSIFCFFWGFFVFFLCTACAYLCCSVTMRAVFLERVTLYTRDLFHSRCSGQLVLGFGFFFLLCLNKTCVLKKSACKCVFTQTIKRAMKFTALLVNINATMHIFTSTEPPTPPPTPPRPSP